MKKGELGNTTLMNEVKELLEGDPRLRDYDNKLYARIVMNHLGGMALAKAHSAYELLCMIAENELPSFETVSRHRRILQNDHEHLRGTRRQKRLDAQEGVQEDLGYILSFKK